MPRLAIPLSVALLTAACAADTAGPTTTVAVEEPSTTTVVEATTTSVVEATTTSGVEGPVDICPRGVVWKAGVVYSAGCFAVPVSFEVDADGWRSRGGQGDWVFVSWVDPGDGFRVSVAVTASRSSGEVSDMVEAIVGTGGVEVVGGVEPGLVSGFDAMVVDVEGSRGAGGGALNRRECALQGESVFFGGLAEAYPLAGGPSDQFFGVGKCHVARVWVFEAGGYTMTIIGGTDDPARHDEALAKIEELFEGMAFNVGAGS